ncbi:TRAP transporter substrate-binding protein [Roseomonas indoligenes]|uniref:TRAP transporter substrate-binding protein n=1 Tax=Roseomonas indoligenes TaxID=2820811 RepID=A0A940MWY0_9PROT|nr:TRAP transporter substrate-binding protein [Pararoseomonas indoligenes]MBP0494914.1 TRAP transporter substrate-binding protein [Pararoseomonas indoligenes]
MTIRAPRRAVLLGALAAPLATPFLANPAKAQTVTLRSSDVHPDGYPTVEAVKWMSKQMEEKSGGRVRIQVYGNHTLGEEKDTLEQTRFGVIDLNRVNSASLNSLVPETVIPGLPFLFRSEDHMHRVLDGAIGDDIVSGLARHNLVPLCYYDSGARSFYTRTRAINEPGDLRGLKIRVQPSDMWVAMMRAFGANATPLPTGEVYSAIQTGVVDGAENNYPSYQSFRHFEVAKFYSASEHSMAPEVLVMAKRSYDKLPKDLQDMMRQAAKDSVPEMRRMWQERSNAAKAAVIAAGSQINTVNKAPFEQGMGPVYDQFVRDARMKGIVAKIRETA